MKILRSKINRNFPFSIFHFPFSIIMVEPTMCAKNFLLEVFWRYLFFKKGSKINPTAYHRTNVERTMCAKNFPLEVFWRYLFFKKGSKN